VDMTYAYNKAAEKAILAALSLDAPWALIQRFSTLVRESGSQDERTAARYIIDRLKEWGVPHTVYGPELYLSVPVSASVELSPQKVLRAKTPAFSQSTGPQGLGGEVVYVPTSLDPKAGFVTDADAAIHQIDVRGKIVLIEGFAMRRKVLELEQAGAIGQIYVHPGENIHWGICSSIWGAPDPDSIDRKPQTPNVSVNRPDGETLIRLAKEGSLRVILHTELDEGWKECLLPVAEIPGASVPDKFVLVHGHYDSWGVGIGDNATGDGALLELARVFWQNRGELRRSVRIAWWPGHSTGRYAGSTWYADQLALDLDDNCIAQVNIDSPGCRWATEYTGQTWTSEAEVFCQQAIGDATGQDSQGGRPHQAGDYSFNNIGLTSFFMLFSTMPAKLRQEKGYYHVGGGGGNIAWHTEDDTLEIADRDNLLRDMHAYGVALSRLVNAPVLPFDFAAVAREFIETLTRYQAAGQGRFDFCSVLDEVKQLEAALEAFNSRAKKAAELPFGHVEQRRINDVLMQLARVLVPINFTREGRFRHDPAWPIPPLPDLALAEELAALDSESDRAKFAQTHLLRGRNRVAAAVRRARRLVQSVLSKE